MTIKNWTIGMRLGAGFALVLALLVAVAGIGVLRLQGVGEATQDMASRTLSKERLATAWQLGTATNSVRTFSLLKSDDVQVQAHLQKQIAATSATISETQKALEALLVSPEELALSADIQKRRGARLCRSWKAPRRRPSIPSSTRLSRPLRAQAKRRC